MLKPSTAACSACRRKASTRLARRRREQARLRLEARHHRPVAQQRVADMRHVHADLVGAAGLEPAFDEAGGRRPVGAGEGSSTS